MLLALKVDVDTLRGALRGTPRLVEMLRRHGADATFLWSLGPDHTGRAIRRALRPGFVAKVGRTGVLSHYGLRTLLYGTLLPGPDIGRSARGAMIAVRDAGFENGVHAWDHVRWQDGVARADADWTEREMGRAVDRFVRVFGERPRVHGAAGWQMNLHALRLTAQLGFEYCSDGRGRSPHVPAWRGEAIDCPQLPTTLPTLDELIGREGLHAGNVASHLLAITSTAASSPVSTQVYTLHAELEGGALAPVFEQLLAGWRAQGWRLVSLRALRASLAREALPICEAIVGTVPGRSGTLLLQGRRLACANPSASRPRSDPAASRSNVAPC